MNDEFDDTDFEISDWKITYAHGSELEYEIDGVSATVSEINASPRGCGIGTALCRRFEKLAADSGCKVISVPASLTSEAIGFWLAMGYDVKNKNDRRKVSRIIESSYDCSEDTQGIVVLEKRL